MKYVTLLRISNRYEPIVKDGMAEEKKSYLITPVDRLPDSPGKKQPSLYGEIIEDFIKLSEKYAIVNDCGRSPITIYVCLRKYLKKTENQNVRVILRKKEGKVYLARNDI